MCRVRVVRIGLIFVLLPVLLLPVAAQAGRHCKDKLFCDFVGKLVRERPSPEAAAALVQGMFKDKSDVEIHKKAGIVSGTAPRGLYFSAAIRVHRIEFQYRHGHIADVWMGMQEGSCLNWPQVQEMFGAFTFMAPVPDSFVLNHQRRMPWGKYVVGTNPGDSCVNFFTIEFEPSNAQSE